MNHQKLSLFLITNKNQNFTLIFTSTVALENHYSKIVWETLYHSKITHSKINIYSCLSLELNRLTYLNYIIHMKSKYLRIPWFT
jgi:hypothetical protein